MDAELLVKAGVIVAVLALLWVLPDLARWRDRRLPRPSDPSVEQIGADAQRIRTQIREAPPGIPVARMRGWVEAYDDVLVAACRTLGLEQRIGALPEGAERELERERIERVLEDLGVLLRSPT